MTRGTGFALLVAILALPGCAAPTRIVQEWQDPAYAGPAFRRVLVMGITADTTYRRVFEDEFAGQLSARGVEAVQSYRLIPEDNQASRDRIERAVREAGADGVFMARLLRVERRTEIVPGPPTGPYFPSMYGYYGYAWGGPLYMGYAAPPTVMQYTEAYVESCLFAARSEQPVWTAVSEIFAPSNARQDSADFSRTVIEALVARKLI